MTDLVMTLGTGKGTWGEVFELARIYPWRKVFIITSEFGKRRFEELFKLDRPVEYFIIDGRKSIEELVKEISDFLKDRVSEGEVAVNFVSGSGKEHMALITALINIGRGVRLVTIQDGEIVEL